MQEITKFLVTMKSQDKSLLLELGVRQLDPSERTRNALKWLGICWGLMLASVPIALAHFVLVPSFFLAGLIMAWIKYNESNQIQGTTLRCAACESELPLEACPEKWPLELTCPHCRNILTLTKTES